MFLRESFNPQTIFGEVQALHLMRADCVVVTPFEDWRKQSDRAFVLKFSETDSYDGLTDAIVAGVSDNRTLDQHELHGDNFDLYRLFFHFVPWEGYFGIFGNFEPAHYLFSGFSCKDLSNNLGQFRSADGKNTLLDDISGVVVDRFRPDPHEDQYRQIATLAETYSALALA